MKPDVRELKKIGTWLVEGDTGSSSLSLAAVYLGTDLNEELSHPLDPSDFRRCVLFLDQCVHESKRLGLVYLMSNRTKEWRKIYVHWLELMKLFKDEQKKPTAPRLYEKMKSLGL